MHQVLTFKASYSQITNFTFRCSFTLIFTLLSVVTFVPRAQAQGFGVRKIKVPMSEKLPPAVYPVGADLLIEISSQAKIEQQLLQRFQDALGRLLSGYDWRLNIVSDKPETILSCVVLEMQASSRQEIAYRSVYKKIGEHTITDSETGITQTVDDFGNVDESYNATILEGRASARYEIKEVATNKMLEASTLTTDFRQSYEFDSPGVDVAYTALLDNFTHLLNSRFKPTFNSPIVVYAPKGKVKRASALLKKGLWNSALEELQRLSPMKKPEDDAYRLYAYGLAYEGLAYETADLASSKSYLEQAAKYYDNASKKNSGEPNIQNAAYRTSRLSQSYKSYEASILAYETRRQQRGLKLVDANKILRHFGTLNVVTNDAIIAWAKAGTSEKTIAERIKRPPAKYFDLSTSGIAELTAAGVSPSVIDAMRRTMIPNQYNRQPRNKWLYYTLAYALIYPLLFIR
jgi:hypothetical protein